MEFTKNILISLKDSGKNICVYSVIASKLLINYSPNTFHNFSSRSYYFWIKNKRPIPMEIVLKMMKDKKLNKISIEYFCIDGGNKIKFPNKKDLRFCYLLGLILGDGCLVHQKKSQNRNTYLVQITFREKKEADFIKLIVKQLFEINSSIYNGRGCYNLCIYSKPLVLILNKKYDLPIGKKYNFIKVPNIIKNGNGNMKKAFLKGVFDSDGNIYNHKGFKAVQLRQKSGKFLSELKELFSEIDIHFNNPYYDKANNSWVLWSSKKDLVDNFINVIIEFNACLGSSAWIEHLPSNK